MSIFYNWSLLPYDHDVLADGVAGVRRVVHVGVAQEVVQRVQRVIPENIQGVPSAHGRDGEVPQMTTSPQSTSPRVWEDLAPGTGPQYRSLLCLSRKNRTSSPLQVLNFQANEIMCNSCNVQRATII